MQYTKRFIWQGRSHDHMTKTGEGDTHRDCYADQERQGSATCYIFDNPAWVDPETKEQPFKDIVIPPQNAIGTVEAKFMEPHILEVADGRRFVLESAAHERHTLQLNQDATKIIDDDKKALAESNAKMFEQIDGLKNRVALAEDKLAAVESLQALVLAWGSEQETAAQAKGETFEAPNFLQFARAHQ